MKRFIRILSYVGIAAVIGLILGLIGFFFILSIYGQGLPDYRQLADYEPPIVTRLYAGDGRLMKEYATEKRVYVPIEFIPKVIIKAVMAAEDKNFYEHRGVDFIGIARAVVQNINNYREGRRLVGASTITQQVAKNFLLGNEKSLERKIKEAILAFRIERAYSKEKILELYLNEIYFGYGAYGVGAAALNYFNKSLNEITVAEAAYLAALPKGPNNYHPIRKTDAALERRNWVLMRMWEDGHVNKADYMLAKELPLGVKSRWDVYNAKADYFAEEVRRFLLEQYGEESLYKGGLTVRTTLDSKLQKIAEDALLNGLVAYDRRHGWRGPVDTIGLANWQANLDAVHVPGQPSLWQLAVVLGVGAEQADIGLRGGERGIIPLKQAKWARKWINDNALGAGVGAVSDVLKSGDVVLVERLRDENNKPLADKSYALRQMPAVDGSVVAIDPYTGRVLALVGGLAFERSQYNRATQAYRQPGSSFKPFVYMAALDNGFTPADLILDAPFVVDQGGDLGVWKPDNYTKEFYGAVPMRIGIEKSRNLMTVRLAQAVGLEKIAEYVERFGVIDGMPPVYSAALGSVETTLLRLTTGYAMIANGGKRITPSLIDRVQDRYGKTIYRHDQRQCENCQVEKWNHQPMPQLVDKREQVIDATTAYQMTSMLEGVVKRGTARRINFIKKPLAGKTGTTNDSIDTWFVGFSPNLVVGVFVGFDTPKSLGRRETGANIPAPIFGEVMSKALEDQSAIPFRVPPGLELIRINHDTGQLAKPGDKNVILEAFKPNTEPSVDGAAVIGGDGVSKGGVVEDIGVEGIY